MTQYGQDYRPKYTVGQHVIVHEGSDTERYARITGRRVYRDKHHQSGDTYYELSDDAGAWEWSLSPTSDRVRPEVALARILDAFEPRLSFYKLTCVREHNEAWRMHVHMEVQHVPADGYVERVDLWAFAPTRREVETIGEWEWRIGEQVGLSDNLGAATVATYNGSMTASSNAS